MYIHKNQQALVMYLTAEKQLYTYIAIIMAFTPGIQLSTYVLLILAILRL